MKAKKIEVEGSELILKNKAGDYVIIPKKYRLEVQDMIDNNCHSCIDALVDTLPVIADYAEDGSLLPDWDKVKSTLNPKNWGVPDYTDKYPDKEKAFRAARNAGEKEYLYKNVRYSTNYKGNHEQQLKETGITDEQLQSRNIIKDKLYNNLQPRSYEDPIKRTIRALTSNNEQYTEVPHREDAYSLYMGRPQVNNTFGVSRYKPSIKKESLIEPVYYKINHISGTNFEEELLKNNIDRDYDPGFDYNDIMGNYTISKGEDEHGKYISYYDKWDLNPFSLKNPITKKEITTDFGKPFEIYNRVYYRENPDAGKYKEYGDKINALWEKAIATQDEKYVDEANKLYTIRNLYYSKQDKYVRQYYSDKELSELDVNKKNFDTLSLQRELSNRGYKLPKSTKKGGSFDGIWGDETKQALLDYQTKNKKK